jgi:cytidyltransferase-like protein
MIFNHMYQPHIDQLKQEAGEDLIGLTSGTFDLFHAMHLRYLNRCWGMCRRLIVGVDSDELVRHRKGIERPIIPQYERLGIVAGLKCVSAAFLMDSYDDFWGLVEKVTPKYIFKNVPFHQEHDLHGAKVVLVSDDMESATSTTSIIRRIRQGTSIRSAGG